MAQYSYPAEYQVDKFTDALEVLSPVVALRRIRELDTNSKLVQVMPFNIDHVGDLRDVLRSIYRRKKSFVPCEAATNLLHRGTWSDAAFEAVMAILRDAAPISSDELRDMCHRNWGTEKAIIFKTHGLSANTQKKTISQRVETLLENLSSTSSEWKNLTRKEGLYYDLDEYPNGGLHRSDMVRLAKRCCEPNVAGQAVPLIVCGQPSSKLKRIAGYMKKYICDSDNGPRFVSLFCDILGSLNSKDRSKVICAIDTACEKLCEMPRAIARNFHHATTNAKPLPASGNKEAAKSEKNKKNAAEGAKAAVRHYFARHGGYENIDKTGLDRLLKDLARACDQWDSDEHCFIPDSVLNAPINVAFDLNNAMIEYVEEKTCKHEGSMMSPGRI